MKTVITAISHSSHVIAISVSAATNRNPFCTPIGYLIAKTASTAAIASSRSVAFSARIAIMHITVLPAYFRIHASIVLFSMTAEDARHVSDV